MKRSFSGIQPTGDLHIGNYLGAIKTWVEMQDKYDATFCIVDLHALTIRYDTALLAQRTLDAVAVNMACGLDPAKCTIFIQSHIPEHSELCWILDTVTPMGELSRMTQFKEKSQQLAAKKTFAEIEEEAKEQHIKGKDLEAMLLGPKFVNVGLFNYPVLMAADILLYKGEVVPVGEDQIQHLEFAREVTRKFNKIYGEVFPEPQPLLSNAPRVIGLDGVNKMSKSLGNHIALMDPPEVVWKKLSTAMTDPARLRRADKGEPTKCNIYAMHRFFSSFEQIGWVEQGCRSAEIGCVDCKKVLAENINKVLAPIQSRYKELTADMSAVKKVVADGAAKVKPIAEQTMKEVRKALGLYI